MWAAAALIAAGAAFSASVGASADPVPSPAASPAAKPHARAGGTFSWGGNARAFYFQRINGNTCLGAGCDPKGTPNSSALNFGGKLHGQYTFAGSPWTIGATYLGADPFGANPPGVLGVGYNPLVDNTLPGYAISTLAESYLQYEASGITFKTGKEIINTPWANDSDSRMVPVSFQGTLLSAKVSPQLTLGAMYMARFKSRVTSAFNSNTLLTSCNTANPTGKGPIAGEPGTFTVEGDPCNPQQTTPGFALFSATYDANGLTLNADQYQIYDLVRLTYADVKYSYERKSPTNPFVAAQYLAESDTGRALLGTVRVHGSGFEFGESWGRNVDVAASYNQVPFSTYVVTAADCSGDAASPSKIKTGTIFGGVPNASATWVPAGKVLCYGGGIASPYTDNYETDPLFTTSIGQGLGDIHKGGTGVRLAFTIQTNDRRLKTILSEARYDDSLPGTSSGASNSDVRTEANVDVQYFFSAVVPGRSYRGLSIRERWVNRNQTFSPFKFNYMRSQLEYDF